MHQKVQKLLDPQKEFHFLLSTYLPKVMILDKNTETPSGKLDTETHELHNINHRHKMLPHVVNVCTEEYRCLSSLLRVFLLYFVLEGCSFFALEEEVPR